MNENENYELAVQKDVIEDNESYEGDGNNALAGVIGLGVGIVGTLLVGKGVAKFKAWRARKNGNELDNSEDSSNNNVTVSNDSKVVEIPEK